jgi:hypothetical protein
MASTYEPSAAMARTARTEIERIGRAIEVIEQRRAALLAQAAELQEQADDYARRQRLLEELVQVEQATPTAEIGVSAPQRAPRSLRGRELRRAAARLLWTWKGKDQIHYREWFERVLAEGYATGGKDPAASFLTNIRDSPAVVRGSAQGFYRLDPTSVERVEQARNEIQAELTDVERSIERAYAGAGQQGPVEALRTHRDSLKQRLKRLATDLDEVRFVFGEEPAERHSGTGVGSGLRAA